MGRMWRRLFRTHKPTKPFAFVLFMYPWGQWPNCALSWTQLLWGWPLRHLPQPPKRQQKSMECGCLFLVFIQAPSLGGCLEGTATRALKESGLGRAASSQCEDFGLKTAPSWDRALNWKAMKITRLCLSQGVVARINSWAIAKGHSLDSREPSRSTHPGASLPAQPPPKSICYGALR